MVALFPFTVFGEPYRRQSSFFLYGGHRLWLGSRKLNSSVQERAVNGGKNSAVNGVGQIIRGDDDGDNVDG